jgi:hypothetical protein
MKLIDKKYFESNILISRKNINENIKLTIRNTNIKKYPSSDSPEINVNEKKRIKNCTSL